MSKTVDPLKKIKNEKLAQVIEIIIKILLGSTFCMICFFNIAQLFQTASKYKMIGIICFFTLLLFVAIIVIAIGKTMIRLSISGKFRILLIICVLGVLVRISYSYFVHVPIVSDMEKCYNAALQMAEGNTEWATDAYFQRWGYQIPFVLYESLVLRVFRNSDSLLFLNVLYGLITAFAIYKILYELTGNRILSLFICNIYLWFPSAIMIQGVLYNQIIGGMFLSLALLVWVKHFINLNLSGFHLTGKWGGYSVSQGMLVGLLIGLAHLFRSTTVIALIGVICYSIYTLFNPKLRNDLPFTICVIFIYYLIGLLSNVMVINSGLNPNGIANGCPLWHILCGLTPDSYGQYSMRFAHILELPDWESQLSFFRSSLNSILSTTSIKSIVIFFIKKLYTMWGGYSDTFHFTDVAPKVVVLIIQLAEKVMFILIAITCFMCTAKPQKCIYYFFAILAIGFSLPYILFEIQTRYRYEFSILAIIILAFFFIPKMDAGRKM